MAMIAAGNEVLVAAGVLVNADGAVLLARRPAKVHQGGLWEFPGGKVELNEAPGAALQRELAEELGIEVVAYRPLIRVRHTYAERVVVLDVYSVTEYRGTPRGLEGQPLAWVMPDRLHDYPMPAADRPIVQAIRLPACYLITPPAPAGISELLAGLEKAIVSDVRLFQLRLKEPFAQRSQAAHEVAALCRAHGVDLLINGSIDLARALDCGVHLTARQLAELEERPLPPGVWVAASCHSRTELERAASLGLDFAVLSPVKTTSSHPERKSIGWRNFERWVEGLAMPVFALGGLGSADVEDAWMHGGQGIAAIRGLWLDSQ